MLEITDPARLLIRSPDIAVRIWSRSRRAYSGRIVGDQRRRE